MSNDLIGAALVRIEAGQKELVEKVEKYHLELSLKVSTIDARCTERHTVVPELVKGRWQTAAAVAALVGGVVSLAWLAVKSLTGAK